MDVFGELHGEGCLGVGVGNAAVDVGPAEGLCGAEAAAAGDDAVGVGVGLDGDGVDEAVGVEGSGEVGDVVGGGFEAIDFTGGYLK